MKKYKKGSESSDKKKSASNTLGNYLNIQIYLTANDNFIFNYYIVC